MNNILQIDGSCVYTLCIICAWHLDNFKAYLSKLEIVNVEFCDSPGVLTKKSIVRDSTTSQENQLLLQLVKKRTVGQSLAIPKHKTPQNSTPHHITPYHSTPHHITPTLHHKTPHLPTPPQRVPHDRDRIGITLRPKAVHIFLLFGYKIFAKLYAVFLLQITCYCTIRLF